MTLFGIGPGELLLVLVIALAVVGPKRLPEMARQVGKALRDLRQFVRNIDPQLLADFREVTQDLDTVRAELTGLRAEMVGIQGELADAARDVTRTVNDATGDLNTALTMPAAAASLATATALAAPAAGATALAAALQAHPRQAPIAELADEIVGERVFVSPDFGEVVGEPVVPVVTITWDEAEETPAVLPQIALTTELGGM